ncbi:hypothetical protein MUY27_20115 [Mucilaginibacter sp. RS28]|uniref:MORN repeat variant n=1 Tax=Mucilaginibacter straminoryzae TaxID=2932774 RepID=A0A9X1X6Y4_9SPHI|nr:hypothetical protein [Mucilaginibacter straminoryzae]MCJ8212033.1 hypothetical protein [Mucilaginibacter straminoryzae]
MMKRLVWLLFLPLWGNAQKLPDFGVNKVRFTQGDQTIVAELLTTGKNIFPENDRTYYWYSANNIRHTQGGFSGRLLNGVYTAFYPNNNLKEQGYFNNGLKDGLWHSWNENGSLHEELNWNNGILNGKFRRYDEQGNLKETGKYKKGRAIIDSLPKPANSQIATATAKTSWLKRCLQKLHLAKRNSKEHQQPAGADHSKNTGRVN